MIRRTHLKRTGGKYRGMSAAHFSPFQYHSRAAAQGDRARLFLDRDSNYLAQPPHRGPKLKIKEMGSRYLFICLYVWLEKYFSRGDYKNLNDQEV